MDRAETLKKIYFDWLFKNSDFINISNDVVKINTSFYDNQFDSIVMYAEFLKNDEIIVTDDGWTISELENHGIYFSQKNKTNYRVLQNIVNNLGIENVGGELFIKTSLDKFAIAKQRLLQGILQVNDLITLQKSNVNSIFFEEVESILNDNAMLFSTKPSFAGKGGVTVQFDFSIPTRKKNKTSENLIRTIRNGNNLARAKILTMDTQLLKNYKSNVEYFAIFDDETYPISKSINDIKAIFSENSDNSIKIIEFSELKKNPRQIAI